VKATVQPATAPTQPPAPPHGVIPALSVALVAVTLAAMAIGLVVAGGGYTEPGPGLPDPGPLVVWGAPVLRALVNLAAIATVGFLLAATLLDPSGKDGVLSRPGRRDVLRAGVAAGVWALLAFVAMLVDLANILALPLSEAISPDVVSTYAMEVPTTRALVGMVILAVIVCAASIATATTSAAVAWLGLAVVAASLPVLAGHSAGLGDHALAITSGVAHVVAAVLWIGGLMALALHAFRRDMPIDRAVERFSTIALISIVLLAASGIGNAYTRLENGGQLLTTGYGQVVLAKAGLIVALGVIGALVRRRIAERSVSRGGVFARLAGLELGIMAIAVGLGVALASSPIPRTEVPLPTYAESLLGFAFPPPPTLSSVAFSFAPDVLFLVGCVVAGALYVAGVVRLVRRGDRWPVMRTVAWLAGLAVVLWCTNAGIAEYAQVSVGLHMLQHMTLAMLGPIFLVLGAPATLALRALKPARGDERGPREWLVWFLHSWITRILTNPFYVFVVYVIGLYGLYFTPLFGWLMGSHVGHVAMQLHFLVSGYLFYWVLIGIDPRPRPLPYWGRLLLLLIALAVHGFFAVALMGGTSPLAAEWYGLVQPPWVEDALRDSLNGAQVAWALSEIPSLIVLIVIAVQWSRSDAREATRNDRQADRDGDADLTAYNARLAALARRDTDDQARGT
jgi:putative copper resistance protein D